MKRGRAPGGSWQKGRSGQAPLTFLLFFIVDPCSDSDFLGFHILYDGVILNINALGSGAFSFDVSV